MRQRTLSLHGTDRLSRYRRRDAGAAHAGVNRCGKVGWYADLSSDLVGEKIPQQADISVGRSTRKAVRLIADGSAVGKY